MATQTVYFDNPADITNLKTDTTVLKSTVTSMSGTVGFLASTGAVQYGKLVPLASVNLSQLPQTPIAGLPTGSFSFYDIGINLQPAIDQFYSDLNDPTTANNLFQLFNSVPMAQKGGFSYALNWLSNRMFSCLTGPAWTIASATGYTSRIMTMNVDGVAIFNTRGGSATSPVAKPDIHAFYPPATGSYANLISDFNASTGTLIYVYTGYSDNIATDLGIKAGFASGSAIPLAGLSVATSAHAFLTDSSPNYPNPLGFGQTQAWKTIGDIWAVPHMIRGGFPEAMAKGIGIDVRYNGSINSTATGIVYSCGIVLKLPLKSTVASVGNFGETAILCRLLWNFALK